MLFLNPNIEINPTSISRTLFEKKVKIYKAIISLDDIYGFRLMKTLNSQPWASSLNYDDKMGFYMGFIVNVSKEKNEAKVRVSPSISCILKPH